MVADLITQYGYIIVFFIPFLEMIFLLGHFIPGGNTFLVLIGFLTTMTNINFFISAILAFVGTFIGNHISYLIGKNGGKKLLNRNSIFYTKESFEKFQKFFNKHAIKAILLGRPISILRQFHAATAGATDMDEKIFTKYNLIGAFLWVIICMGIGWIIGMILKDKITYDQVKDIVDKIVIIFTALSILALLTGIFYKKITSGKPINFNHLKKILKK